jgi:hypothetical protein
MKKVVFFLLMIAINTTYCAHSHATKELQLLAASQKTWHCMEDADPGPNEYNDVELTPEQRKTNTGCEFSTTDFEKFKKHISQPHNRPPGIPEKNYCFLCKQTLRYSLHPGVCIGIIEDKSTSPQTTSSDREPK